MITSVTEPNGNGPLGAVLSVGALRSIGAISYGLYLWHWPIYVYLNEDRTQLDGAALLAFRLVVTFAIAIGSYCIVEQPLRHGRLPNWSWRVAAPIGAATLAVALVATTSGTVPRAFQEVSAAELAPPAAPGPVAAGVAVTAPAAPLRVMLVGDSVARSLGPGIGRAGATQGIEFWDGSVPGCGLATDVGERWFGEWQGLDQRCVPGWRERWPAQVAQFRPDVVVALFGAQDAFDRRIDGQEYPFDSEAGMALAERDLQAAVTSLSSSGAEVVLLTAPYYKLCCPMKIDQERSPVNEAWVARYNQVQVDVAHRNPTRVRVMDLNKFLDPEGTWTATVDGVAVRTFDRSHLSDAGADLAAGWLVPQLLDLRGASSTDAPTAGLVATAGARRRARRCRTRRPSSRSAAELAVARRNPPYDAFGARRP